MAIVPEVLSLYSSIAFTPPDGKFTVLAAFALVTNTGDSEIIALGTGSKCLPTNRLPLHGEALHDSHAEVLARRGVIFWMLQQIERGEISRWFVLVDGKYALKDDTQLVLYISTVPCGDASTGLLAALQDPLMAALKDDSPTTTPSTSGLSRGRDNYALLGVLRTKPGRADSPPTTCMSCSDKIASWNVLGIQGALASNLVHPIFVSRLIIGDVPAVLRKRVQEDCLRALWGRLDRLPGLPPGYKLHKPVVEFTDVLFVHSAATLGDAANSSCNDSVCWNAGSQAEVLINGFKRGVSPKHRDKDKFKPRLCQYSIISLYRRAAKGLVPDLPSETTYHEAKQTSSHYQIAKRSLMGKDGPFARWMKSPAHCQDFGVV